MVALQVADAHFTQVAGIREHLAAFQRKPGEIRRVLARHMQAEPLFGHRVAILQAGIADGTGVNTGEARQIVGHELGIAAVFADVHQHVLAFTVRCKTQIFHHHEIFRIGFQHPGALRPAMQPGQIRHIHAVIP